MKKTILTVIFAVLNTTAGAAVTTTLHKEAMNDQEFADFGEALQSCSPAKLLSAIKRQAAQKSILNDIQAPTSQKISKKLSKYKDDMVFRSNPDECPDWDENPDFTKSDWWNKKKEVISFMFCSKSVKENLGIATTSSATIDRITINADPVYGMSISLLYSDASDMKTLQSKLTKAGFKAQATGCDKK